MTANNIIVRHVFAGGFSTDRNPSIFVVPQNSVIAVPHLQEAENCLFTEDGGIKKSPGTIKINAAALEAGSPIAGIFDFHRQGTIGSPTQQRIVHVGTVVKADNADGVFNNIKTGLEAGAVPSYAVLTDSLVYTSDSTVDVPQIYDQTTNTDLGGSPPNMSFVVNHKNQIWGAGIPSDPSLLAYSAKDDPEVWDVTGAGGSSAGTVLIDPDDGARIIAAVSHNNELIVFKGPERGSIHRITGDSEADYAVRPIVRDISGPVSQASIFGFGKDIGWVGRDGTINSLNAVEQFGDYEPASLSRDIDTFMRRGLNFSQIKKVAAANDRNRGVIMINVPRTGAGNNDAIVALDYRFSPIRVSVWTTSVYGGNSIALIQEGNDIVTAIGGTDGFLRYLRIDNDPVDDVAIEMKIRTPYINIGAETITKTLESVGVGMVPRGDFDFTLTVVRDGKAQQQFTLSQQGGDLLGSTFILGSSVLTTPRYLDTFTGETVGDFRGVQYALEQTLEDQDFQVHSIISAYSVGGEVMERL